MQSSILTDLDALNNMAVFLLNKDPIFSSALAIFILTTFSFVSLNLELNKQIEIKYLILQYAKNLLL